MLQIKSDEPVVIEGEVTQVLDRDELDRYAMKSTVNEAARDGLAVIWMDVPDWQRRVAENRVLDAIMTIVDPFIPRRFLADIEVVTGSDLDVELEAGDDVVLEAVPAVAEARLTRGSVDCDVQLWDVVEAREVL